VGLAEYMSHVKQKMGAEWDERLAPAVTAMYTTAKGAAGSTGEAALQAWSSQVEPILRAAKMRALGAPKEASAEAKVITQKEDKEGVITLYTLRNTKGMEVRLCDYGAAITAIVLPDACDVVLASESPEDLRKNSCFLGVLVGRQAARTGGAQFHIDGVHHKVTVNDNGRNHLHGGATGLHNATFAGSCGIDSGQAFVDFAYTSPDGEDGYPGEMKIVARYTLTNDNKIVLSIAAECTKACPVNFTNHSYFNLNGHKSGDVSDHIVRIFASKYVEVDNELIATGKLLGVSGGRSDNPLFGSIPAPHVFDFRKPTKLGPRLQAKEISGNKATNGGYDHTFLIDPDLPRPTPPTLEKKETKEEEEEKEGGKEENKEEGKEEGKEEEENKEEEEKNNNDNTPANEKEAEEKSKAKSAQSEGEGEGEGEVEGEGEGEGEDKGRPLLLAAEVRSRKRRLRVWTDMQACHFYTGNFLDGKVPGKDGAAYPQFSGLCLECENLPNAINLANQSGSDEAFKPVIVGPGSPHNATIVFDFSQDPPKTNAHFPTNDVAAALIVQKLFRGFKHRHLHRQKVLQEAWEELEKKEENEIRLSSSHFGKLTTMYKELLDKGGGVEKRIVTPKIEKKNSKFKPTLSWLSGFMDRVATVCSPRASRVQPLPYDHLMSLLDLTYDEFAKMKSLVPVQLKGEVKMIVVGDLHGQVEDLLFILNKHGLPSRNQWFLFNGDFVDRGYNAIEICIILFSLKLLFGDWVFLNRGNHEAENINSRDGFQMECVAKYNSSVYQRFNEVFSTLPIATLVNESVLVVHGGIPYDEGVTLAHIENIDRFKLSPLEESVMEDMLWSDPGGPTLKGATQNSRGCGCVFGEDILDDFLEDNPGLRFIVRSHEMKASGFQEHFHGKLLTVFSASNYTYIHNNEGAVIELASDLQYDVHRFYATPREARDVKFSERYSPLARSVAAKLISRIAEQRLALLDFYAGVVYGGTFKKKSFFVKENQIIARTQWARGLREVLGLNIRFLFLQSLLGVPSVGVDGKRKGKFNYVTWLSRFAPHHTTVDMLAGGGDAPDAETKEGGVAQGAKASDAKETPEAVRKIVGVLQKHRVAVKSMFRYFDLNLDGVITPEELANGLLCLGEVYDLKFEKEDVKALTAFLDKDKNNNIDYAEFFDTFTVTCPDLHSVISAHFLAQHNTMALRAKGRMA